MALWGTLPRRGAHGAVSPCDEVDGSVDDVLFARSVRAVRLIADHSLLQVMDILPSCLLQLKFFGDVDVAVLQTDVWRSWGTPPRRGIHSAVSPRNDVDGDGDAAAAASTYRNDAATSMQLMHRRYFAGNVDLTLV